ncbi:MAG TPA: hypothetical protein VIW68_09825 [Candidatus Sulfotelmatobacter sp.]
MGAAPVFVAPLPASLVLAAMPADPASADELVRQAIARELAASEDTSVKHQFRSRKTNGRGGSQTKLYVETRDVMAGMVIAYDDHPLTEAQMAGEQAHLQGLLDHPEMLRRKHSQENGDSDRSVRILKALPDAFLYQYDGTETATNFGKAGDTLVRLKFRPNPNYSPPSRVEQVLTGMQGMLLIDREAHRLAKIDGTLFKDVTFGWGFLGRLEKGGHFAVEQSDVGDGSWEVTHMTLNIAGKILLFRSFNYVSDEVLSDFRQVPANTTFAQGVELLRAEELKIAQSNAEKNH